MVVCTSPGNLPNEAYAKLEKQMETDSNLTTPQQNKRFNTNQITIDGQLRFCNTCHAFKPDRAYHCSQCNKCILRFDHHCPWTGHCIGNRNHKIFYVFLFWVVITLIFNIGSIAPFLKNYNQENNLKISGWVTLIASCLTLISVGTLLLFQTFLICTNQTTVEYHRKPRFPFEVTRFPFSLNSKYQNWVEMFGKNPLIWFIPVCSTEGNGLEFDVNRKVLG